MRGLKLWIDRMALRSLAIQPIIVAERVEAPDKDIHYWVTVASVLSNPPFIQELLECQQKYEKQLSALALEDDFKPERMREARLQLNTIKNFAAQLAYAGQKVRELRGQTNEES